MHLSKNRRTVQVSEATLSPTNWQRALPGEKTKPTSWAQVAGMVAWQQTKTKSWRSRLVQAPVLGKNGPSANTARQAFASALGI